MNIAAVAFISREVKTAEHTLLSGFAYTLGRGVSYTLLATLVFAGLSVFQVSSIFQGWGDKVLGPILIMIGLLMSGVIKINFPGGGEKIENMKIRLAKRGYVGSFFLGMLFALAFCPYSGVLFFGMLIPLILQSDEGLLLAPIFALGTGLPVIIFSFLIAFAIQKVGQAFQIIQKIEKIMRYGVAAVFIGVGVYYTRYLVEYLINK
jgi:cytochrome c biogenesis protein CcdA